MPRPCGLAQGDVSKSRNIMKTPGAINENREDIRGRLSAILNRFSYFGEVGLQSLSLGRKRILKLVGKIERVSKGEAAAQEPDCQNE